MMKMKNRIVRAKLLAATFLMSLCGCGSASVFQTAHFEPAPFVLSRPPDDDLIANYKNWTRVNPKPAVFDSLIMLQCASPTVAQSRMEKGNPHRDKFVTVYVNDIGKHAMLEEKEPHFPQGSIIVKEKLPNATSASPELLTVMVKRHAGYNPDNGDWEYIVFDGAGKNVQAQGKIESCQACHQMEARTDYVSRNYLPREVRDKLK